MTITLPGHPLQGQAMPVLLKRRQAEATYLMVQRSDGLRTLVPVSWTDLVPARPLVAIDGREPRLLAERLLAMSVYVRELTERRPARQEVDSGSREDRIEPQAAQSPHGSDAKAARRTPERQARAGAVVARASAASAAVVRSRRAASAAAAERVGNARAEGPSRRGGRR